MNTTTAHITSPPSTSSTSYPTRPKLQQRHSSQSSHASEASSDRSGHTATQARHTQHHPHKVSRGHGRLGAKRNTSFGHNLQTLKALTSSNSSSMVKMPHTGGSASQPGTPTTVTFSASSSAGRPGHARSKSGEASGVNTPVGVSPASTTRPGACIKRNASAFVVSRNTAHHSALKKNHSHGNLTRNLSGKNLAKQSRAPPQPKRKHSGRSDKSVATSPVSPPAATAHPTVRFALADDDGDDEEDEANDWTEESASVSPNVTRDHTRSNSVVLDPNTLGSGEHALDAVLSGEESTNTVIHEPARARQEQEKQVVAVAKKLNGESSYQPPIRSQALDADAITSRLLARRAPSPTGSDAKVTHVSALVHSDANDHRTLSHSQASIMAEGGSSGTPGRDLVSRFVSANSTDGTPRDGNLLPNGNTNSQRLEKETEREKGNADIDASKRNKSAPNFAAEGRTGPISPAHSRVASRRSGTGTGSNTPTDLPPSRTQQKLLLQRASSALEPAKHIPAVLPRPGAAQLLGHGLSFNGLEGGTPAQIQALFAQIGKEYNVVRRYRNPIADAAARAREIPRAGKTGGKKVGRETNGAGAVRAVKQKPRPNNGGAGDGDSSSPEQQLRVNGPSRSSANTLKNGRPATLRKEEQRGHKSRVSFDLPSVKTEESDEEEGAGRGRDRNEAYEICRRLWDLGEDEMRANGVRITRERRDAERVRKSKLLGFETGRCPPRRESSAANLLHRYGYDNQHPRRTSEVSKSVPLALLQRSVDHDYDHFDEPVTANFRLRTRIELERGMAQLHVKMRTATAEAAKEEEMESSTFTETLGTAVDGAFELAMPRVDVGGRNG